MRGRLFTSFVALLYLSVVAVLGMHHRHDHSEAIGHDSHCAACQWHLQANAEMPPCAVVLTHLQFLTFQVPIPVSSQADSPYVPSTDSRAPPIPAA